MRWQSDYDSEIDALLRQADDGLEEWWEGEELPKTAKPSKIPGEEDESTLVWKREVRKRGFGEEIGL